MRKSFLAFTLVSLVLFSCGGGGFDTDDIENNTASADQPKNTHQGPLGDVRFKDTSFMFGDVKDGEMVQHKIGRAHV